MAALVSAWTLLKNRGQELDLPPPATDTSLTASGRMTPQDLTDAISDQQDQHARSFGGTAGPNDGRLGNSRYDDYYGSDQYRQELERDTSRLEGQRRQLDQQTMTREGQQGEADEMDEMGTPEMGRSVGGRAPPNVGRAGSSDTDEEDMASLSPEEITRFQDYNVNQRPNPFPRPTMKSLDAAWSHLRKALY